MFFVINEYNASSYQMSQYYPNHPPQNFFVYYKVELPAIFPTYGKPLNKDKMSISDKEITLKFNRRMIGAVKLDIGTDTQFQDYELEVYPESGENPIIKKTDRSNITVSGLKEDQCYKARVRGMNDDLKIQSKWSKEVSFFPLKSKFYC